MDHWQAQGYGFLFYSTFQHTREHPRWRAVFPLSEPVAGAEWPDVYAGLVRLLADGLTDPNCKDSSRMYYLPACPPGSARFAGQIEGRFLSPDEALPYVPDPNAAPPKPEARPRPEGVESPGDWFNRTGDWAEILQAAGGTFIRMAGRRQHWLRPGKRPNGQPSATTGNGRSGQDLLKVFTNNWAPFEPGEVLTKFFAYTLIYHGRGEFKAAIAAIKQMPDYPGDDGGAERRPRVPLPDGPPLAGFPDDPGVWPDQKPAAPVQTSAFVEDEPEPEGKYLDPVTKRPRNFAIGDIGNAERFIQYFGSDLRYVPGLGWHVWSGSRWKTGDEGATAILNVGSRLANRIAKAAIAISEIDERKKLFALSARLSDMKAITPMLKLAAAFPQIEARPDDFDRDPFLLGTRSGVVDLRTGQLRPASPADMITMETGCGYEQRDCPHFLAFVEQIMLGRQDLMQFLMLSLGYSLSGSMKTRALWFCTGTGGNGKGALIRLMKPLVGDYGTSLLADSIKVRKQDQIPSDIAKLHKKRFVTVGEVDDEMRLNVRLLKTLSGFDPISARYMFKDFFDFIPHAKIWMAGNQKPQVRNFDNALRQRLRVVPFDLNLPTEQQDGELDAKLWSEASGILWLLVQAYAEFEKIGLPKTDAVEIATDAYQAEADSVVEFLEGECDLSNPESRTPRAAVFRVYGQWCRDNRLSPLGKQKFYERVAQLGVQTSTTYLDGNYPFVGIRLKGDSDYRVEEVPQAQEQLY